MATLASNGSCYTAADIKAVPHLDAVFFCLEFGEKKAPTAASDHLQVGMSGRENVLGTVHSAGQDNSL